MMDRLEVTTVDGGSVTVWVAGRGPALVLVHGSLSDHSPLQPLIDELYGDVSCYALDRRGFGASPDGQHYSAEREFSDVATVVAEVADRTGEQVALFGHSWGASCALGAAPGLIALRTLILYEPSLGLRYPPGTIDRMAELLAAGDADSAVVTMLQDVVGLTADEVADRRQSPAWQDWLRAAPTMIREARIEESWLWEPARFATISVPTLLLTGSKTTPDLAAVTERTASAIPRSRLHTLQGHGHLAHRADPAGVAQILRPWLL